jgi:hypothetical protein
LIESIANTSKEFEDVALRLTYFSLYTFLHFHIYFFPL